MTTTSTVGLRASRPAYALFVLPFVTFYALLAIFPAIGAFVSLYGLFADVATVRDQLNDMSGVFPASVVQIVGDQMLRIAGTHDGKLTIAFVISLLVSMWSANAGMKALFEGLNVAYDETESRPCLHQTLISYVSQFMSLQAGDVISTGTPPGVGMGMKPPMFLKEGDVMELGIDKLGSQKQTVYRTKI